MIQPKTSYSCAILFQITYELCGGFFSSVFVMCVFATDFLGQAGQIIEEHHQNYHLHNSDSLLQDGGYLLFSCNIFNILSKGLQTAKPSQQQHFAIFNDIPRCLFVFSHFSQQANIQFSFQAISVGALTHYFLDLHLFTPFLPSQAFESPNVCRF